MTPDELLERYIDPETGKLMERVRALFANELPDCPHCGEPFCHTHNEHYAVCPCPGPCEPPGEEFGEGEEWVHAEIDEVLYWVRPQP